jgi:hypothetical protein
LWWWSGPYYQLGTIGAVLAAYYIFKAYEGMEGRKIKRKIEYKIKYKLQKYM